MKVTLEFDLNKDGEQEALDICQEAGSVKSGLYEFQQALRSIYKYEDHTDEVSAMVERIRVLFYDSLGEYL